MVLAIDEKVVTRFREVELAVADKADVYVTVWRDGEENIVPLATAALTGTTSIASSCGRAPPCRRRTAR